MKVPRPSVHRGVAILVVLIAVSPLWAQQQSAASQGKGANDPQFTRTQVLLLGAASYGTFLGADLLSNLVPSPYGPIGGLAMGGLSLVPLWFVDLPQAAVLTGSTLASMAGGIVLPLAPDLYGDRNATLSGDAITIGSHLGMWTSYEAYARARVRTKGGPSYQNYTFGRLFAAPFQAEPTARWSFWVPLIGSTATNIGLDLLADRGQHSVFTTGRAFLGPTPVPILVGFLSTAVLSALTYDFVGIGEEAISRDLEYKELTIAFGIVPAKIINSITFPALHVAQEVRAGYTTGQILVGFAYRAAATLGLQWAYDQGGLPSSVALHTWIDTAASLVDYLLLSGAPRALSLSFSLRL